MKHILLKVGIGTLVLLALIVAGSFLMPATAPLHPITLQSPDGKTITLDVEHAVTESQQARGLMNRRSVTHGMLFVFTDDALRTFWMKNTLVPLDIIFFDDRGRFVSSTTMQPCTGDPCPLYSSDGLAMYALEMPAGFVAERGVGKNWKIGQ